MGAILDRFGQDLQGGGLIRPVSYPLVDLDARSSALLEPEYATRPWRAGMVVPVPVSSAACVTLGYPAPTNLWTCDEAAGNLVDEIAAAALVPTNAPLQNRTFQGAAGSGSFWAKAAVETVPATTQRFDGGVAATLDIDISDFTFSWLLHTLPLFSAYWLVNKFPGGPPRWAIIGLNSTTIRVTLHDASGTTDHDFVHSDFYDGGIHLLTLAFDRDGNTSLYLDGTATVTVATARPGTLSNASVVEFMNYSGAVSPFPGQCAWMYHCLGTAASRTGHDALWRHALAAGLGSNFAYTRAAPWRVAGAPNRVFSFGAGQVAVGYHAGLVEAGNPDGLGIVEDGAATFLGINSSNMPGWTAEGGPPPVLTAVDGPSGLRDALRVDDQQAGTAGRAVSGSGTLGGATNVPHIFGVWVRAVAAGGLNALITAYFAGDAGGAETLTVMTLAGTVPAAWTQFTGTVTPTRAGHTSVVLRCYPTDGVVASTGTVDFAEAWGVQNRSTVPVAWRAVGAGAAVATAAPAPSFPNVAGQRYNPARGRLNATLVVSYIGSTVMRFAEFYSGGSLAGYLAGYIDNTGKVAVNLYDANAVLVASALSAAGVVAIGSLAKISVLWDARNPLPGTGSNRLAVVVGGALVATGGPAAWTPAAAAGITAWMGNQSGGAGIYGAISRYEILSEPGSIYDEQ